jgi:RNA polymerase sigma-70 factor (ECF subfamily)
MPGHSPRVSVQTASADDPPAARTAPERPWTFDAVYEGHFAFVWRTVRRLGVHASGVEDVVQDVFLVVHRRLATFEGNSSVRSWLFSIVVRVVRDARRSLQRKPANLGGPARAIADVDSVVDFGAKCPHESAAKAEAMRTLHAVLDAMPDERREVFILAELEQLSVVDIARAVGANVNTVYSRLRAARADFERGVVRARASDQWRMQ